MPEDREELRILGQLQDPRPLPDQVSPDAGRLQAGSQEDGGGGEEG